MKIINKDISKYPINATYFLNPKIKIYIYKLNKKDKEKFIKILSEKNIISKDILKNKKCDKNENYLIRIKYNNEQRKQLKQFNQYYQIKRIKGLEFFNDERKTKSN